MNKSILIILLVSCLFCLGESRSSYSKGSHSERQEDSDGEGYEENEEYGSEEEENERGEGNYNSGSYGEGTHDSSRYGGDQEPQATIERLDGFGDSSGSFGSDRQEGKLFSQGQGTFDGPSVDHEGTNLDTGSFGGEGEVNQFGGSGQASYGSNQETLGHHSSGRGEEVVSHFGGSGQASFGSNQEAQGHHSSGY